jgi:hypothetical protein
MHADVVWPALVLEQRTLSVLPITAGLIVEWLALCFGGFGLSWKKAAVVDVVMNAVSTGIGVILIPALGLVWELGPGQVLFRIFNIGTFNPGTWAVTFLIAVLAATIIEASVVRWGFKIPLGRRRFSILCAANCASVAIAFASIWLKPPRL